MDIIIKTEFDVGDLVKVKDSGESYTSNTRWAKAHNLKMYANNEAPNNGVVGEVVAVGLHQVFASVVYGIRVDDRNEFIVGESGLVESGESNE